MENVAAATDPAIESKERLIIALDVPTAAEARSLVAELREHVGAFKVGMQLFTASGPNFVRELTSSGLRVFLDLKFHDIPNTVALAAVEAARLGVWLLNVHAAGGREMMVRTQAAVHAICALEGIEPPKLIAVTVLTSSNEETMAEAGVTRPLGQQVIELAKMADASGFDGVVASPLEAALIRQTIPKRGFIIVTPGIRANSETADDQKRVMTFAGAVAAGSDYLVVGRPVTQARDRVAAVRALLAGR